MDMSPRKGILAIVAVSVVLRLGCMVALQSWKSGEDGRYGFRDGEIGAALAAGDGFSWPRDSRYHPTNGQPQPTAWQAPVYPYIIGAAFGMLGTYSQAAAVALIVLQALSAALSCVLLVKVGQRLFDLRAGFLAALIFALYPSALYFSAHQIELVNLLIPLLLLFMLQMLRLGENSEPKGAAAAGGALGIGLLTDPTIAAFLPFALGWLLLRPSGSRRSRIVAAATLLLVAVAVIAPWQVRNHLVFGRFFFIKSNLGRELLAGNYGDGEETREIILQGTTTLDEGKQDKLFQNEFLKSVVRKPGLFVRCTVNRVVQFWATLPVDQSEKQRGGTMQRVVSLSYLAVLTLGLTGLGLTLLKGAGVRLLSMALLSLPVPYYLTWYSRFRYRFPLEAILIVFAAYAVARAWQWVSRRGAVGPAGPR